MLEIERFLVNRWISHQAHNTLSILLSRALLREGIYFAARTLFDKWRQPADRQLADTFDKAFVNVLDRSELHTWRRLRNRLEGSRDTMQNPAEAVMLRVAAQAPQADELTWYIMEGSYETRDLLVNQLLSYGQHLIERERYDAGLAVLVGVATRDLGGVRAIRRVQDALGHVTPRIARVHERVVADQLVGSLDYFAATLARTRHYSGAVHMRLLARLIGGDIDRFKSFGLILFDVGGEKLFSEPELPLRICVELSERGYRTQATELLAATTGATEAEGMRWRQMYEALPDPVHLKALIPDRVFSAASVSSVAEPLKSGPAVPVGGAEVSPAIEVSDRSSLDWPRRQLNAWIDEPEDVPDDEFDLCADIGTPREGAMGRNFTEPAEEVWQGRDEITIRIVASGLDAVIRPGWYDLKLRRTGRTETARFRVKTTVVGLLKLDLRVYLAEKMLLIDEHRLEISVSSRLKVA